MVTPQQLAVGRETQNNDEPGVAGRVLPGSVGNGLLPSADVSRLIHRRRLLLRQWKGFFLRLYRLRMMNPALLPNLRRMHDTAAGAGRVAAATHVVVAACAAVVVAVDTPAQLECPGKG